MIDISTKSLGVQHPICIPSGRASYQAIYEAIISGLPYPQEPVNNLTPTKAIRNMEIRRRYREGELMIGLAQYYGTSEQRVYQIVRSKQK